MRGRALHGGLPENNISFRTALKSPLAVYAHMFDLSDMSFDHALVKLLVDYKRGRLRQARKRFDNLLTASGLDPDLPLIRQQDRLTEALAPLLLFELLFHMELDSKIPVDELWGYVGTISLFDPDDLVCHGAIYNMAMVIALRHLDMIAAMELAQLAIEAYRAAGTVYLEGFVHLHLAYANIYGGDLNAALAALDEAGRAYRAAGDPACEQAMVTLTRCWVEVEQTGRFPSLDALTPLQEALVRGEFWPETLLVLAALQFRTAQAAHDDSLLERHSALETILRVRGMTEVLPAMQLLRDEFFLRVPKRQDRMAPVRLAERHLILLLPTLASLRANWGDQAPVVVLKLARLEATQALLGAEDALRSNRFDEAARLILTSFDAIEVAGWTHLIYSAQDLLDKFCAECRVRQRFVSRARHIRDVYLSPLAADAPMQEGPAELTPAEYAILCLLPDATSNKALARVRGVSEATVKFHLKSIYTKLGVNRRRDAIEAARRLGWIGG